MNNVLLKHVPVCILNKTRQNWHHSLIDPTPQKKKVKKKGRKYKIVLVFYSPFRLAMEAFKLVFVQRQRESGRQTARVLGQPEAGSWEFGPCLARGWQGPNCVNCHLLHPRMWTVRKHWEWNHVSNPGSPIQDAGIPSHCWTVVAQTPVPGMVFLFVMLYYVILSKAKMKI